MKARVLGWGTLRYVLAGAAAIVLLTPLVWAVSASLHTNGTIFSLPFDWLPKPPHPENYTNGLKTVDFGVLVLNSLIIGVAIAVGSVVLGLMSGYALAKRRFFGRDILFWSIVATLLIPFPAIMVGVFILARWMNITNSYAGVIIPGLLTGQVVFFMRQYLQGIPDELIESARVDGAGEWRILWRIVLPLSWPVMISMGILTFVGSWNNLLWPLIVIQSDSLFTIPLGLTRLKSQYSTDYVSTLAVSVIAIIPVVILYLIGRKKLLDSIIVSGGAVKG
jgi:ABC-type glycerol-3-phosphate transport system permease component